ncbi:camphor resistance protein CrcB [Arcticibacter tournemirensis]|uniref:Fluoride-specific ion channel FluC n=1 Tax=Arcticibacter tournemirensis TaxID=699437 RepID=A0A5M9HJF7_9SPHI|nr:fluoride efflux transporter CrcB [Arcticibacter tournemirensis]KAA8485571.1 fluoride efflux transporter CrcB [Arcticibacter tournemirensis]TQM48713.1 camphor resistance protein CrcB [Arcticibacter tournemirensis]
MKIIAIIFLGGGLGSVARFLVNRWLTDRVTSVLPYGTFLVNVTGCFLIGFLVFYLGKFGDQALNWRLFLVTGICGGYTTFSSFSFENVQLVSDHQLFTMLLYTLGSIVLGFLATYMGILLARTI